MEYLDGETLSSRLAKGRLPLAQTLQYAIEIADALDKAHRKGVTHRDLKPGNIMLTKSGAKLLDFGLAKLKQAAPDTGVPLSKFLTRKDSITAQGMIAGTLQYMAPEQLEGKETDARSDIFSFGTVVYEMVTGEKAFEGESAASTIAKILGTDPPPICSLQPMTPPELDRLVKRCLVKDPDNRLQSAHDAKMELEGVRDAAAESGASATAISVSGWRRALPWATACVAILAAVALAFVLIQPRQTSLIATEPVRFQIPVPEKVGLLGPFAVSPDGRQLAFVVTGSDGVHRVWVRNMDSLEARPLPGSETTVDDFVFWSPDSRFIAFPGQGKLKKINVSGGSAQTLCDTSSGNGGSWNRDGVIIFGNSESGTLMRVSADGGIPSPLTALDSSRNETYHALPSFLPDGRHFMYLRFSPNHADRGIYVGSLDAKPGEQDSRQLVATDYGALYAPSPDSDSGRLLFLRGGTLLAQPFDPRRLKLTGEPASVAEQVESYASYGFFSASTNGVLTYWTKPSSGAFGFFQLTWYDRQGKAVGKVGEPGFPFYVALSPDGSRAAVMSIEPQHPATHIFLLDLLRRTTARFTFGSFSDWCPVWSPDGSRIIFASDRVGKSALYEKPVDGGKNEELLLKADEQINPTSWSHDGRFVLYHTTDTQNSDLWVVPLDDDKKPIPFLRTEFDEWDGHFSPDGHWVAYDSNESGRYEIYVRRFSMGAASGAGPVWLISTAGGWQPRWREDGKELYYVAADGKLMAVGVTSGQVFRAGIPKPLFSIPVPSNDIGSNIVMDAAADGKRFLFRVHGEPAQPPFTVVQNWQAGLKK
jgi:Tol biopolymer transport system component